MTNGKVYFVKNGIVVANSVDVKRVASLRAYQINNMATVGSLTQEEFEKMRTATDGELARMGIQREKKFRNKRMIHLNKS